MALSAEDLEVVATARRDGAAVVRNLLTPSELASARRDFDAAHLADGKGRFDDEENAATRTGMLGDHLGLLPGLAQLYAHPRIVGIVGAIMGEDCPFLHEMKTNRYTAGHQGVTPHSDNGPDWSMPWEKIATMIFLTTSARSRAPWSTCRPHTCSISYQMMAWHPRARHRPSPEALR